MNFFLEQDKEKIFAIMSIEGKEYRVDATEYFKNESVTIDWMFYRRKNRLDKYNVK